MNAAAPAFRRILLKLSGESLMGSLDYGTDPERVAAVAQQIKQVHVNPDKHDSKTIEQLRGDLSAKTGENVVVRRFSRFAVGE